MAAPTLTPRVTPADPHFNDGYQSLFTFSSDPNISVWERTLGLPGQEGGDAIDLTTQHNADLRTKAARQLKEHTEYTIVCGYAPEAYTQLEAMVNVEQSISRYLPAVNGAAADAIVHYGYLKTTAYSEFTEGEFPTVTLTIVPTDRDPSTGGEQGPVYHAGVGTGT